MKYIVFLLITFQAFAQHNFNPDRPKIQAGKYFNSEVHFFPAENSFDVFYLYKISYSQLFFEKIKDDFDAGINVHIEVQDTAGNTIKRLFDNKFVSISDFDLTNSESTFIEGLIKFNLPANKYRLITLISDQTSKREVKLRPIDLDVKNDIYFHPIVVDEGKIKCDSLFSYYLANNSGSVPFNHPTSDLIIPVTDIGLDSINITVKQKEKNIIDHKSFSESIFADAELELCNDKIVLNSENDSTKIKYFVLRYFPAKLYEGPVIVEVNSPKSFTPLNIFNLEVIWINKPFSLNDPEKAIKYLEIIEPKDKVSDILSESGDEYTNLMNYWKPKDPTPNTTFNELMSEFYARVDYSEKHFKTIGGNGGAYSDRGKTYIRFGAPDFIDRYTNNNDDVVETWVYNKLNRTFLFIDKDGTGKFQLAEGK